MDSHNAEIGGYAPRIGVAHPGWSLSAWAGVCAFVAGPAIGLALVAVAVEGAGLVAGWPATFPTVSSTLFPQLGYMAAPLALAVFAAAFLIDAVVRRWVFRRLARAEISLTAAMVSIPLSPGLWLVTGISHTLPWYLSIALGIAFLRWRSRSCDASLRPRLSQRWCLLVAATLTAGLMSGAALVASGPHLASAAGEVPGAVGPSPSPIGNGNLAVWRAWPLNAVVGKHRSRVVYYTFGISTVGPLPITVRSVTARASGPGIQVLQTTLPTTTIRYGDAGTVRVTLLARRCPVGGGASVSAVRTLTMRYSLLGVVHRTSTMAIAKPLRLTCPAG